MSPKSKTRPRREALSSGNAGSAISVAAAGKSAKRREAATVSAPFFDRQTLLLSLALFIAVCACYAPVIHNEYLNYDDNKYVTDNPHVKTGLTWATVKWAFKTTEESNWHPLTWLSHLLDYQLFGLNPAGTHGMNVLLHALNAALLLILLQASTGFRYRSLAVAALFALHPMNVESVAWAAERKNVLSMTFFLLAFCAYVWYTREPRARRFAWVAGLYTLALMSKPQVITFPFLLLLWDYWPLGRILPAQEISSRRRSRSSHSVSTGPIILEKLPLFLLSAASAVITMEVQKAGLAVKPLSQYSPLLRIETATVAYMRYLGKLFWPVNLVGFYPHPTELYPAWQVLAAFALLLGITLLVVRARGRRYLSVGWFWFLGSLVPMIGLVQVGDQAMADRYAYIPYIGLFVMVVWSIADWVAAFEEKRPAVNRLVFGGGLAAAAVCTLVVLGALTFRQVKYWHDSESFWQRTLTLTQNNYFAEAALAGFLRSHGRTDEAMQHYRAALAIRPDDLAAILNLGAYEHSRGNLAAAIEQYRFVAERAGNVPFRAKAYANMGYAYRQMGQDAKAEEAFESSLQLVPDQPNILVTLGLIEEDGGNLTAATEHFSRATELKPSDVGLLLLCHALQQQGRTTEANDILQRASRISRNLAQAEKQADALRTGK
jgi:protein O-mannosyl-transferase